MSEVQPLPVLAGAQATASSPDAHVWLSASAGTGKTQVLAARVFRLLLRGVDPSAILCLTFTKAGAAEMAHRINARLAAWVRMPATELSRDLDALGERPRPELQARARTLFARVLDAPGGGLRIQTIHGFCQGLLAAFPVEAGLTPGFRPLDAREEAGLAREALAGMLATAEREGRTAPVERIGRLSLRLGEGGAEQFLAACARALPALDALPPAIQPWLRRALDLPTGDIAEAVADGCAVLDEESIAELGAMNREWGTKGGVARADTITAWLARDRHARAATLSELHQVWAKADGEMRSFGKGQAPQHPDYPDIATDLHGACAALLSTVARAGYADLLADGLEVGRDYARAYAAAKRHAGAVDFEDLIQTAVALLDQPGIGEWVRFKLDRETEHVLIDEAQDTNAHQWRIVRALADEFFVGRGIHAPATRTLFTVGDYKQAIFGFQGTDPVNFEAAEIAFGTRARAAAGDDDWPEHERGLPMERLSLTHSFRSTRPVLEFVDAAIAETGDPGLGTELEAHASEVPGPGEVMLWPPVVAGGSDADEEGWVDDAVREVATRIARQVRRWLDEKLEVRGRALRPEDVMILVKRRGELASLLVARLYAEGVPVAGVDRLRLNAPLAVQDLLAAIRFVLQPDDDLTLASLLMSPLVGWSQEELLAHGMRERGSLWRHLLAVCPDRLEVLRGLLGRADFTTPYQFLEEMLSGPLDGRRKLLLRLGAEARDPIEELLSAALSFEQTTTPSLQRFLDWFDRGDVDIVRDPSAPLDAVRVMTAHGAKGLQAPLVILADATLDPALSPRSVLRWTPPGMEQPLPIVRPRGEEKAGPMAELIAETERRERAEHWRLFYVAATRAEEKLVIAGALNARSGGVPPEASWYAAAARGMDRLGVAAEGERRFAGTEPTGPATRRGGAAGADGARVALPDWIRTMPPEEARPPRPLAPSALGDDQTADPPPTPAMRAAAERGKLAHALFQRLPAVTPDLRAGSARAWLNTAEGVVDQAGADEIVDEVLRVMADPSSAPLFGPDAFAEAPIAAVIGGGVVVSGTVDRLLVEAERVLVADFKTSRRPPATVEAIPVHHLRQMAAYAAALAQIFPGRKVEAMLIYTAGPVVHPLDPALLERHKPGLAGAEQS